MSDNNQTLVTGGIYAFAAACVFGVVSAVAAAETYCNPIAPPDYPRGVECTLLRLQSAGRAENEGGQTASAQRLMSFNVRHCTGVDDRLDIARTAERIRAEAPDFVGLQEIDRGTERVHGVDEAAELARLTGLKATFAKAIPYRGGEYGVAILSKTEPIAVSRTPLPGKEPRVLLFCEFGDCVFGTTHLAVDSEAARAGSVAVIRAAVASFVAKGKPVFLCGDWNSLPDSEVLNGIGEFMTVISDTSKRTFHGHPKAGPDKRPADLSRYCIDYIAVDSAHAGRVRAEDSRVIEDRITSDHAPIAVSVRLH